MSAPDQPRQTADSVREPSGSPTTPDAGRGPRSMTGHFVAGFLIEAAPPSLRGRGRVLSPHPDPLIAFVRKNRPDWQAGFLNAVGGRIEPGESAVEAMRREFREETSLDTASIGEWEHFATVEGDWGLVHFYRLFAPATAFDRLRTTTDERIEVYRQSLAFSPPAITLPSLSWLLPLALYRHDTYAPVVARETSGTGWNADAQAS